MPVQDDVASSKQAAYSSPQEAAKHHWSAILFVTRKMTAMGLSALFKHAPCLKRWKAATLVGYGSNVASSCLTSKVSAESVFGCVTNVASSCFTSNVSPESTLELCHCMYLPVLFNCQGKGL